MDRHEARLVGGPRDGETVTLTMLTPRVACPAGGGKPDHVYQRLPLTGVNPPETIDYYYVEHAD